MKWSFGICFNEKTHLDKIILSIKNQKKIQKKDYEILIVSEKTPFIEKTLNNYNKEVDIRLIEFDESIKEKWITKKKNSIALYSKYQNICFLHDYIGLCKNWYYNFVKFGEDWDVCMNPVRFLDNSRFRDWIIFKQIWGDPSFISYYDDSQTKNMYVSGTYWCAKKFYMMKNPLNENLTWGQGEDLEWSHRCRLNWNYKINIKSPVKLLKEKTWMGQPDYCPHPNTDPNMNIFTQEELELQD